MLRLAVLQPPAELATPEDRLNWLRATLPNAADADLALLPEMFATGYNIGGAIPDRAEPQDGSTFRAMAEIAQLTGLAIHYGYVERDGDTLFNAAACVSAEGTCPVSTALDCPLLC